MDGGDLKDFAGTLTVVAHSRLQTLMLAAAKAVVGTKIRWPQGHAGSTPARGTTIGACLLTGEPFRRRHAPDVQRRTAAAQSVLRQMQYGDGADIEFAFAGVDFQCRSDSA